MGNSKCSILVVDDERINVALFTAQLKSESYITLSASSGEEALKIAEREHPDLILLDVMMPGMSGFEVAERLKSNGSTKNIPIIMITALDDRQTMIKGLQCGVEEFLTKPVLSVELLLRVRNLLKLKKYQDLLAAHSIQLEEQVAEGNLRLSEAQEKLIQSEKLASIGQLAAGVAHEINNPIGFVKSNFSSLKTYVADILDILQQYEAAEPLLPADSPAVQKLKVLKASADLPFISEDIQQLIAQSQDGIARVAKIIQDLKDFARSDSNPTWVTADVLGCLDSALNIATNEIKYKASVVREYGSLPEIECLPAQLGQVFLNILVNAAQAIDPQSGLGKIVIRSGQQDDEHIWVEISDTGCGMSDAQLKRIFDPFYTTKAVGVGTGLGLSISYGIIQRHGGNIRATSTPGEGTTFRIELPVRQAETQET
ncbi:MAG: histidine kinase [Proteobacteria bacterium]|nr:histidine kinase [Pseudomonadota bacterium]